MRALVNRLKLAAVCACLTGAVLTGTAAARPEPTLGLASAAPAATQGFGTVRPATVSYGGDGQSLVWNVHWQSWGGVMARGTGRASWVWPGWCSACGAVTLPADVVAWHPIKCHGQSVYAYVEWYFPTRGMTFSPSLAEANLCTGKLMPGFGRYGEHHCPSVTLHKSGGGVAGWAAHVTTYAGRASCTQVRRLIVRSAVMHHYAHDARFESHGWWCGSQKQMDFTTPPVQQFSCETGDYRDISFEVTPPNE